MPSRQLFRHLLHEVDELDPCRIKMDLSFWRYFPGSTVVLEEPCGAGYMPGGVWPCGLVAGAPPLPAGGDRAGPALRLLLSLHLWHDCTAGAPLGFVRFAGEVSGFDRFITEERASWQY